MHDIENVIRGLECCRKTYCERCPYNATDDKKFKPNCLINEMISDALALLKEQGKEIKNLKEIIIKADCALETIKEKLNELLYEDFREAR